jgi:cytochrome P450
MLSKFTLTQIIYLAFGTGMDLEWMHERQVRIGKYFAPHLALSMFFGPLVKYIPGTPSWKCTQTKAEIENYMYKFIDRIQKEEGDIDDQPQNLVKAMLKNGQVSPREIVDEATTFLFAGFDTTATTLAFALWYLSTHTDTMRWLQEEIDEVFGAPETARGFKPEDLPLLKRTRAIINETLRLRPPANSISRTCDRDVKVGDYIVPAGSCIEVRIFMTQRDPKYWKEPNSFIPQRWMDEKTERHPFSFVPFSAGSRNCIGKNFAMQEAIIALSMLMSRFTVEMDESRGCEIKAAGVNAPHCWLKFHDRAHIES